MKKESLIAGFDKGDFVRVDSFLQKLLPYLAKERFMIVGGMAIRYYLSNKGIDYPVRKFNDLDIKAESANVLASGVTKDFLVYHYHPENRGLFYIVLVDPETKIKIDIFDMTIKDEQFIDVPFHEWSLRVVRLEDQFVKTVYDVQRISLEKRVDPKQFLDMNLMRDIVDMNIVQRIWEERNYEGLPGSVEEAIKRAQKILEMHPDWAQENPFRHLEPYKCSDCKEIDGFPITPMSEIYKILGYRE